MKSVTEFQLQNARRAASNNAAMAKKKTPSKSRKPSVSVSGEAVAHHHLESLLRTMRCIAQYEDALYAIANEGRRAGAFTPEVIDEVIEILEQIPSRDFMMDLAAVRTALTVEKPSKTRAIKKSITSRKGASVSRKKSRKKAAR